MSLTKDKEMKIFLTEQQVIELAYDALDMNCPDPDKVDNIAKRMDMVYNETLDMYEDVEEYSLRALRRGYEERLRVIKEQYAELQEKVSPSSNS